MTYPPVPYSPPQPGYPQFPPPPLPQEPGYPPPRPPQAVAACDSYVDLIHEMNYDDGSDGGSIAGVVARTLSDQDFMPLHNAWGQLLRWADGKPKIVMAVPLMIESGKLTGWLAHGSALCQLRAAMIKAGVPADDARCGPEAGAVISASWHTGCGYQVGYTRPDVRSLQVLAAWQAVQDMSPIERQFWEAHCQLALPELKGLVSQHPVLNYRVDFALPGSMIGIELDGFASHSSTADITRDRQRQRAIEAAGWYLIRFGGAEVHRDAEQCVREAAGLARSRMAGIVTGA